MPEEKLKIIGWGLFIFYILTAIGAILELGTTTVFVLKAKHADGTVVAIIEKTTRDEEGETSTGQYPMIAFSDHQGKQHSFDSGFSNILLRYHVGQHVKVLYRPTDPADARVDAFIPIWGPSILWWLGVAAVVFVGETIVAGIKKHKAKETENAGHPPSVEG